MTTIPAATEEDFEFLEKLQLRFDATEFTLRRHEGSPLKSKAVLVDLQSAIRLPTSSERTSGWHGRGTCWRNGSVRSALILSGTRGLPASIIPTRQTARVRSGKRQGNSSTPSRAGRGGVKLIPMFAWYDCWIGLFWDQKNGCCISFRCPCWACGSNSEAENERSCSRNPGLCPASRRNRGCGDEEVERACKTIQKSLVPEATDDSRIDSFTAAGWLRDIAKSRNATIADLRAKLGRRRNEVPTLRRFRTVRSSWSPRQISERPTGRLQTGLQNCRCRKQVTELRRCQTPGDVGMGGV